MSSPEKKRRPVVHVVCRTGNSGLTDYALCLIPELAKHADVSFITAGTAQQHPARGRTKIVPLFRRIRTLHIDLFRIVGFILKHRPDVVLYQSWMGAAFLDGLIVRFTRMLGIRSAITVHDVMPHHPMPWSRWTQPFLYKAFDVLIAHSENAEQKLRSMGVSRPILVVPHGEYGIFNLDKLDRSQARARLGGFTESDFIVLFFGHLDERKGLAEFLAVANRAECAESKFVVAGQNNLGRAYQALLSNPPAPNIRLDIGHVPFEKVQEYFAACDVVALPYREGSTSGVVKIAMAFGKPVVASRVGDLPETLADWPGLLIDPARLEEDLRDALVRMRAERDNYALGAKEVRSKYAWEPIGAAYTRLLRETMGDQAA